MNTAGIFLSWFLPFFLPLLTSLFFWVVLPQQDVTTDDDGLSGMLASDDLLMIIVGGAVILVVLLMAYYITRRMRGLKTATVPGGKMVRKEEEKKLFTAGKHAHCTAAVRVKAAYAWKDAHFQMCFILEGFYYCHFHAHIFPLLFFLFPHLFFSPRPFSRFLLSFRRLPDQSLRVNGRLSWTLSVLPTMGGGLFWQAIFRRR